MKTNRAISIITAILVLGLAVCAFILSYDALRNLASTNGVNPTLAWIWPVAIDGFLIVASIAVVRNSLMEERTLYQWALVIEFTGVSVVFNVIHAPDTLLAQSIGAIPPLALVLAFELLMAQVKSEVRLTDAIKTLEDLTDEISDKRQEVAKLEKAVDKWQDTLDKLKAEVGELRKEKRANTVKNDDLERARATRQAQAQAAIDALLDFYADNPLASQADAGASVGRSRQWVSATLANLEDTGAIKRNGNGIEIVSQVPANVQEIANEQSAN